MCSNNYLNVQMSSEPDSSPSEGIQGDGAVTLPVGVKPTLMDCTIEV